MWRRLRGAPGTAWEEEEGGGGSGGGGSGGGGGDGGGMGAAGEDPHAWLDQHGGAEDVFTN